MRYTLCLAVAWLAAAMAASPALAAEISAERLSDCILGGWVGQGIGVTYGDRYEFASCGRIIEGELQPWEPGRLAASLGQDDLYVELTFLRTLATHGPEVGFDQAGKDFAATQFQLWHANKYGRENVRKGIMPPMSGHPRFDPHADDIDFQIECDVLGMACPGLPQSSNDLCEIFGHIMNYGDGVYSGMWIAAMYSLAFFEPDPAVLVSKALEAVPAQSRLARCIADVVRWHDSHPNDWRATWRSIETTYQDDIDCTPGKPFNIDAVVNAAYVALALLHGDGDFARTAEIAVRCGQDADCNASSVCGVLGCARGFRGIPRQYTSSYESVREGKFSHTDYTYPSAVDATLQLAAVMIERAGGSKMQKDGGEFFEIPTQSPRPPLTLEQWPDESQKQVLSTKPRAPSQ